MRAGPVSVTLQVPLRQIAHDGGLIWRLRPSLARRLKLRPPFGALCEVLVIVRDLKHHLLGYFVLHIIGKTARFVGEFAPRLTTTRRRKFIDGNHRPAHSLKRPDPPPNTTGRDLPRRTGLGRVMTNYPTPRNHRRTVDQGYGG
jgi:hypothetical protein